MSAAALNAAEPLIEIARSTLRDLRQADVDSLPLTLDSRLDHDLGLDSLARVELFSRVEQELRVRLPESLFESAETLGDIAAALARAPTWKTSTPASVTARAAAPGLAGAPPVSLETLNQVLDWHVEHHPGFPQITICNEGREEVITYENLWHEARAIAGQLQKRIQPGEPVALMLPTSRDYFVTFFGVLVAGGIPVPLYPPSRLGQIEEHVRRHSGILANAGASTLITTPDMRRVASILRIHSPALRRITTADELRAARAEPNPVVGEHADATALLQYTSGSTGQPKGVVLSHANLLSNITALGKALEIRQGDVFVSWLPLYHDMGLIGAWLGTLYFGLRLIVMSPLAFLARPARWLEAIHRYRGTLSAAPNFAYELCLKHVTDEELGGLDLSTWRIAMNGAEAVMPETLARFQGRFGRCGLPRSALTPVYGLAECSVGLTVPPLERGPLIDVIERESFVRHGIALCASPDAAATITFASCGRPIEGHRVRIVDDAGRELDERREGRLMFCGPSATRGYYLNPEATAKLMRDGWLDSGDRAYRAQGEIFVTGRIKDIIIRAGRHIYPDELESAIGAIAGIRKGCVAVFGSTDRQAGTEHVIVLAETPEEGFKEREDLRQAIIAKVLEITGEPPDDVALAAPHTVLKTSSGKIRRAASRELYESGKHQTKQRHAASGQLLSLASSAAIAMSQRFLRQLSDILYGAYFWTVFALLGGVTFLLMMFPLSERSIWAVAHRTARLLLRVTGIRLTVSHEEAAMPSTGAVIVANHSSYLDGMLLIAAIAQPCHFVAKRELARTPIVGRSLRRLGVVFVERFQVRAGVEDAHRIARMVAQGASCIFFAEGTFVRAVGLLPFHLGAFAAAIEADRPVVPVAVRGARDLLPDGQWLPRRTPVAVHIGPAIAASRPSNAFAQTIRLRDAARRYILDHCGEPDASRAPPARPISGISMNDSGDLRHAPGIE